MPAANSHLLTSKNVFILPTRFGFAYLFLVLLLFFLGTNYQNNAIMLLSYLLASLFITVMIHSFFNFSGLSFLSQKTHSGFSQQAISLPLSIITHKEHFDLNFCFAKTADFDMDKVHLNLCKTGKTKITLPVHFFKRGIFQLGRLKISSEYSLGLFVTWTHLDFNQQVIVYPMPKPVTTAQPINLESNDDTVLSSSFQYQKGLDDFYELKPYIQGESLAKVAWKQLAKGQEKLTKHYQQDQGNLPWIALKDMPTSNIELKLQFLAYLIIEKTKTGQTFGLDLTEGGHNQTADKGNLKYKSKGKPKDKIIMPNSGNKHQQACLTVLAHYS